MRRALVSSRPVLVLVGAGPKSVAVLAKAWALAQVGLPIPEIHLVERHAVGAHWNGKCGHTDGFQLLGTSPEKDVGFPYATRAWGASLGHEINARMMGFSWVSYLVAQNEYPDWVDRGRPSPQHRQWARYLAWVAEKAASVYQHHCASLTRLSLEEGRWALEVGSDSIRADGVVVTGPGTVVVPSDLPENPRLLTAESFWPRASSILEAEEPEHIAIVGSGETAAAVSLALVQRSQVKHQLTIVSPTGVTYSRGESFRENRLYTDPDASNWAMLTPAHRREFIRRTDRGVFSQHAMQTLDRAENLELVAGRLASVHLCPLGHPILGLSYDEQSWTLPCDRAILALGTDPLGPLRNWLDDAGRRFLCEHLQHENLSAEAVEANIDYHLSLRNLKPGLHLPMLSGFAQGPGFPNLSCLGRVADRILSAYVPLPGEAA